MSGTRLCTGEEMEEAEPALCVGDMRGNKGRVERAPGVGFAGLGRWVSVASEQVS